MSAIDSRMDPTRESNLACDRVNIVKPGKFLGCKTYWRSVARLARRRSQTVIARPAPNSK